MPSDIFDFNVFGTESLQTRRTNSSSHACMHESERLDLKRPVMGKSSAACGAIGRSGHNQE
jgi:hypothetical protein